MGYKGAFVGVAIAAVLSIVHLTTILSLVLAGIIGGILIRE